MKTRILFVVAAFVLSTFNAAQAQQQQEASVAQVKEQLKRLQQVDADPATPTEIKAMNRKFLAARRAELRALVEKRIEDLRQYRASVSDVLAPEQRQTIEASIRESEQDLQNLMDDSPSVAPAKPYSRRARSQAHAATRLSIAEVLRAPSNTTQTFEMHGASVTATTAPPVASSVAPLRNQAKKLDVAADHIGLQGLIKITDLDDVKKAVKVQVSDDKNNKFYDKEVSLGRGETAHKITDVIFAKGVNTVTVTDVDDATNSKTITLDTSDDAPSSQPRLSAPTVRSELFDGDTRVRGTAQPDTLVQVLKNNDPFGDPVRADGEGNFAYVLRANQELKEGDDVSAKQKRTDEPDTAYSPTAVAVTIKERAQRTPLRSGSPIGYLIGGTVSSQQAQEFQQVDPFFGFVAGYRFGVRDKDGRAFKDAHGNLLDKYGNPVDAEGYRIKLNDAGEPVRDRDTGIPIRYTRSDLTGKEATVRNGVSYKRPRTPKYLFFSGGQYQLLFQGIFQTDARTAKPKEMSTTTSTGGGGSTTSTNPVSFAPFIASRKSFNVDVTISYEFPRFAHLFGIGPYFTWGASTALSKNELQGETVSANQLTNGSGSTGGAGSTTTPIDAGQAQSDNDLKSYREYGILANVHLFTEKLFLQSKVAYGSYEALRDLVPGHDTTHRFIGKLRIIPTGLNLDFGGQRSLAPLFGAEVNAGRGPDQLKFFTGFIIKIKGLQ